MHKGPLLYLSIVLTFIVSDCFISLSLWRRIGQRPDKRISNVEPSSGTDFGEDLGLRLESLPMEFGDHLNYQLNGTVSEGGWIPFTPGELGIFRLGSEYTGANVVLFHQLHCIQILYRAFRSGIEEDYYDHLQHCLFYLQHFSLCDADTSLEPGDFLAPQPFHQRNRSFTKQCADWKTVTALQATNSEEFALVRSRMDILTSADT